MTQRCSLDTYALGDSRFRDGSGSDIGPMVGLDLLLLPAQDENHEASGPHHGSQTQNSMIG